MSPLGNVCLVGLKPFLAGEFGQLIITECSSVANTFDQLRHEVLQNCRLDWLS